MVTNLAAALIGEFGKSVVILDSNINSSHLGLHLGIYEDPPVTIREIIKKKLPVSYGVYVHSITGIRIIPAPLSGEGLNLTTQMLKKFAKKLSTEYEIVIMDCPPGLGKDATTAIAALDSGIVVTTPEFPAVADALKTINLLNRMKKKVIGIIVNRKKGVRYELSIKEIESTCGVNVIGVIPEDKHVPEGVAEGLPVVVYAPYSPASAAFKEVAAEMIGVSYSSGGLFKKIAGAFSRPKPASAYGSDQRNIQPVEQQPRGLIEK